MLDLAMSSAVPHHPSEQQAVAENLAPLCASVAALTWILHDYFINLEDEVRFIWPQRFNFSKFMFFWIRLYSIALVLFNVIQLHVLARPGTSSSAVCLAMDTTTHVVGAILLWSVAIVMQMRVYAIYSCDKRVAVANFLLFLGSIVGFIWILVFNHSRRAGDPALPGCAPRHPGIEWAQWLPATAFAGVLLASALTKTCESALTSLQMGKRLSLYELLLRDNILYFSAIIVLLVFNILMVTGAIPHIPWFGYSPFHAALGISTSRMLINLRRATTSNDGGIAHLAIESTSTIELPQWKKLLNKSSLTNFGMGSETFVFSARGHVSVV
ncbi:hypothetical protein MKEN_00990300 [Mycena kentingensis (nom. inval.)]|nr:hypothetical protein MKEN_00990300 [Mycena kentingensis (nom. inval.)]